MRRLAFILALAFAGPAAAHGVGPPHHAPTWTFEPAVVVPLLLSLALYAIGFARLRQRSRDRGRTTRDRLARLFGWGWLCLALAVVSPLHELGERSFTAHMVEHELLMLIAAPLLVLSRPLSTMIWALPSGGRRALGGAALAMRGPWRGLVEPWTATALQAAALWLWHLPMLFDRALASAGWHVAQHLSFLVSALLFWTAMVSPRRRAGRLGGPVLCLFATSVVSGALGALMAFSQSPWYARYAEMGMAPFGLSAVEDQQLAGLLMWAPGGLVHVAAALALIARALRDRPSTEAVHGPA
ncbi:cytochrome c oxidase assembly protein [Caulobacter sp. LARHSG274]